MEPEYMDANAFPYMRQTLLLTVNNVNNATPIRATCVTSAHANLESLDVSGQFGPMSQFVLGMVAWW